MRGLEFSTVTIVACFLALVVAIILAFLSRQLKGGTGWMFLLAGGILIMVSGLTEDLPKASAMDRVYWGSVFIAFNILGIAAVFAGMKSILGIGIRIRWYLLIALANLLAVIGLYYYLPHLRGLRTLVYGVSLYLLAVPILVREFSAPPVFRFQRIFDSFLLGFLASYGIRMLLALFDIPEDDLLPSRMDSWIVLLYSLCGLFFLVAFVLMAVSEKMAVAADSGANERPPLSLSAQGLSRVEITHVRSILQGNSIKETAFALGVSESTVRNTLARSYKKLGVGTMVGLIALAGKRRIED